MNKTLNNVMKTQLRLMGLSVIAIVLLAASVSYALFQTSHKNSVNQVISIGTIATDLTGTPITLDNIYPMEESELTNEYPTYEFTISNATGDNNYDVNYKLYLTDITGSLFDSTSSNYQAKYANYTALSTSEYEYMKYKIDDGEVQTLNTNYNNETGKIAIKTGTLNRGDTETHTIKFWLSTTAPKSVQGKVLSLQMNMTSTPIAERVVYCVDESGNEMACPQTLAIGQRFKIGDQYFRYIRTTNTSDTTNTYNECQDGGDASIACTDADSRHPLANNQLRLLAEYNLNVGAIYNSDASSKISDVDTTSATYGLQDSTAKGWVSGQNRVGTVAYGASNKYSQSNVKIYTDNYANYLNTTYFGGSSEVSGSAITRSELTMLGCPSSGTGPCASTYPWVYTTSYWSFSPVDNNNAWGVFSNATLNYNYYNFVINYGVRPVISISASSI